MSDTQKQGEPIPHNDPDTGEVPVTSSEDDGEADVAGED